MSFKESTFGCRVPPSPLLSGHVDKVNQQGQDYGVHEGTATAAASFMLNIVIVGWWFLFLGFSWFASRLQ